MPYISDAEFGRFREADARVRTANLERDRLRVVVQESSVLVAGAMRQGYTNTHQREALLYAFCKLADEPDEKLALLKVDIPPKGYIGKR